MTNLGFLTLGIKEINVWFRCEGNDAELRKWSTDWVTLSGAICLTAA